MLPNRLDREVVRQACSEAAVDADSAERAFIVVMAWGYGTEVGYGPWRTQRVLSQTPRAADRLASVARTLSEDGAIAAYSRLAHENDCGLRWLGPAFGSKYLYFCQPEGQSVLALILDRLVATWLEREAGLNVNPVPWSERTYRRYIEQMHSWAYALQCRPDELEYCMFREMANEGNSQWAPEGARL